MNFYQGLLFLNGHILDPRLVDDHSPHYSTGYGNRVANERAFKKLGRARHTASLRNAREPTVSQPALDCCG